MQNSVRACCRYQLVPDKFEAMQSALPSIKRKTLSIEVFRFSRFWGVEADCPRGSEFRLARFLDVGGDES